MVVKLKSQGDLDKKRREYEKNHKKKVEKAEREGKEGAHLPRRTNVPEMTYGCGCASMFTYGTCVAATSCRACKERGSVTETNGKPNCDICSCVCAIGAFKQPEIVELRIRCIQEQERRRPRRLRVGPRPRRRRGQAVSSRGPRSGGEGILPDRLFVAGGAVQNGAQHGRGRDGVLARENPGKSDRRHAPDRSRRRRR